MLFGLSVEAFMKRIWLAGLFILCSLVATAQEHSKASRDSWVRFNSDPGRFTILMPQTPEEKVQTVPSSFGPYTTHLFSVRSGRSIFVVGWVDYDPTFNFNVQSELNANRDNFIQGIKATLINSNNTTIDGYQSLEFTAESVDTVYKSRVFIVGRRPYQLITGTVKGVDDSANTTRFFESFKIRQLN
jgi:hypothetical protein